MLEMMTLREAERSNGDETKERKKEKKNGHQTLMYESIGIIDSIRHFRVHLSTSEALP
jgi:hypothetical protein